MCENTVNDSFLIGEMVIEILKKLKKDFKKSSGVETTYMGFSRFGLFRIRLD